MSPKHNPIQTIWLADDDDDDRTLLQEALFEIAPDVKLVSFEDGYEILHQLRTSNALPDIILLDINMPRKNGFECLSDIKGNSELSSLTTIIWSTGVTPNHTEKAFNLGARLYVKKPSGFNRLLEIAKVIVAGNFSTPFVNNKDFVIE